MRSTYLRSHQSPGEGFAASSCMHFAGDWEHNRRKLHEKVDEFMSPICTYVYVKDFTMRLLKNLHAIELQEVR
jgi:hypothetical protein